MRGKKRAAISIPKEVMDTPTAEQLAKGGYAQRYTVDEATGIMAKTFVARHDPVARWKALGKLSQSQEVVIEMCQRLWRLAGLSQPLTARYDERTPTGIGHELRALTEIEAREDLHRMQDYVPRAYWNVFERICRHAEGAEIVGKALKFGDRSAADRAHQVVCFVADIISMKEKL